MTDPATAFAKMIPGYDLLQGMAKSAGAGIPGIGQWVAPTLDPDELEKRIEDLRTVQFWLEQNARMLATTIQAMEVQRMTLSTLKTMNLSMGDLAESLKIRLPEAPSGAAAAPPAPRAAAPAEATPAASAAGAAPAASKSSSAASDAGPTVPAGVIDPMQWWGALTQQFADIATKAMKDGAEALAPAAKAATEPAAAKPAGKPAKTAKAAKTSKKPAQAASRTGAARKAPARARP